MLQVLIVEDEKPISNLIRLSLTKEGYHCTCAFDGAAAADLLVDHHYDLILLDVMLPEIDGFELMEYIRPLKVPVIFLTAKSAVKDRVKGLKLGAEDYIVKPFEVIELLARIDVVLRRYQKTDMVLEIGGLKIDTASMQVWRDEAEISLTLCMLAVLAILFGAGGSLLISESFEDSLEREKTAALGDYRMAWGTLQIVNSMDTYLDRDAIVKTMEQLYQQNSASWSALRLSTGDEVLYENRGTQSSLIQTAWSIEDPTPGICLFRIL